MPGATGTNAIYSADRFLQWIESVWRRDCAFFRVSGPGEPALHVIVHSDRPEYGLVTLVTFGLSLIPPLAGEELQELVLQVEDRHPAWRHALGALALAGRGTRSFAPGAIFDLGEPVVSHSKMTGFVAGPLQQQPEPPTLALDGDRSLSLVQLYPAHPAELVRCRAEGTRWLFASRGWDPHSVHRKDLSSATSR